MLTDHGPRMKKCDKVQHPQVFSDSTQHTKVKIRVEFRNYAQWENISQLWLSSDKSLNQLLELYRMWMLLSHVFKKKFLPQWHPKDYSSCWNKVHQPIGPPADTSVCISVCICGQQLNYNRWKWCLGVYLKWHFSLLSGHFPIRLCKKYVFF